MKLGVIRYPLAPKLEVSDRHFSLLMKVCSQHSCPQQLSLRMRIILEASKGAGNKPIARFLGISVNTVKQWRCRWARAYEQLQKYERGLEGELVSDFQLLTKIKEILSDRPRSGRPEIIPVSSKQQIIALACESPEDYGYIRTDWTHELLAATAIEKGIVDSITSAYVGVILKNKPFKTT